MKKILVKDLIKKDKQTLIKERELYQKEWERNNAKYNQLNNKCWDKFVSKDLIESKNLLLKTKELLHKNADIRDIIEIYNKALRRKGV